MAFFFPEPEKGEKADRKKFAPAPPGYRYVQLCGKCYVDGDILLLPQTQVEYRVPFPRVTDMGEDSHGQRMGAEWIDQLRFVATGTACNRDVWEVEAEIFELVPPKAGEVPPEFVA